MAASLAAMAARLRAQDEPVDAGAAALLPALPFQRMPSRPGLALPGIAAKRRLRLTTSRITRALVVETYAKSG